MKFIACYLRVPAIEPNEAEQRHEIGRWLKSNRVNPKSVRWYIDKATDDPQRRPKWEALQADVLGGKVGAVVVWRLDRLTGATRDGLNVLLAWFDKSLRVVAVSQQIEIKGPDCGTVASILRGLVEMDEHTRRERAKTNLAAARARGRAGGRPKMAADAPKIVMAKKLQKDHSLSIGDICQILEISRSTYYRYVAQQTASSGGTAE